MPRAGERREDARSRVATSPSPAAWASRFDALLPNRLGGTKATLPEMSALSGFDLAEVDTIVKGAEMHTGVDIWSWMVKNGRTKAAVWLIEASLKSLMGRDDKPHEKHPSNISWPDDLFEKFRIRCWSTSIDSPSFTYASKDARDYQTPFNSEQHPEPAAALHEDLLNSIWTTLGRLVIAAADSPTDQANDTMSAVKLILGVIHNLGMVPDGIYDSRIHPYSVYVQRPPVLHLVSSRILTALSDAVWRNQQDDAIAQATEMGVSLKEISESVPGGRFRLKVRPLGPEIWLEFILWCCVERGHIPAACHIISALRQQTDNPWFAIRWCAGQRTDKLNVMIDWERMQRRHGGTVGLIEGYSREKPFVDVPNRTISVEVVLALLDSLLGELEVSNSHYRSVESQKTDVARFRTVLSFLEPHDLPAHYFDYIESRSMQAGVFDMFTRPAFLQLWSSSVDDMRRLEPATTDSSTSPDLRFESIVANTLLHTGVQHQALDGLIQIGDVHRSLAQFNVIQENVDQQKFKSITHFLQSGPATEKEFFSSRLFRYRLEYADSHGQLPYYKLAGFLNLISDTHLTGLGQWLLYSDDIDGSLIPQSAYGLSCMAPALCRFAAVSRDDVLLMKVVALVNLRRSKPSVRFLRRLFDADVQNSDFANARSQLVRLKEAQAGGVGLANIAHLAGIIMTLEDGRMGLPEERLSSLTQATVLLNEVLRGDHNSVRGDFTMGQRVLFKQQIAHMLKVFYRSGCTTLQKLAREHVEQYRSGNLTSLPANIFNILLSAIVTVNGSDAGKTLWDLYCQDINVHEDSAGSIANTIAIDSEGSVAGPSVHTDASSNISTIGIDAKPDSDFADPFFQHQTDEDTPHVSSFSGFHAGFEPAESTQTDLQEDPRDLLLSAAHITTPNLQTLRIIVRAAVEERSQALNDDNTERLRSANLILKWSISQFDKIGNLSNTIIQQEIEQPVSSLDETTEDRLVRPDPPVNTIRFAMARKGLPTKVPVSDLWVPRQLHRPSGKAGGVEARASGFRKKYARTRG